MASCTPWYHPCSVVKEIVCTVVSSLYACICKNDILNKKIKKNILSFGKLNIYNLTLRQLVIFIDCFEKMGSGTFLRSIS